MGEEKKGRGTAGFLSGTTWFAGWLFTIGFTGLSFWQAVLAIIIWPYYLGSFLH